MDLLAGVQEFLTEPSHWTGSEGIAIRAAEHLGYTGLALLAALVVALPVGLLLSHTGRLGGLVRWLDQVSVAVPLLGVVVLVGLVSDGPWPLVGTVSLLAVPSLVAATWDGVLEVDPTVSHAARGLGMRGRQVILRAELPVAVPAVLAGVRAAVAQVATGVAVAAYGGLGGLGAYLVEGLGVSGRPTGPGLAIAVSGLLLLVVLVVGMQLLVWALGRTTVPRDLALARQGRELPKRSQALGLAP